MGDVISLRARREQQDAELHARALVLFECAVNLARSEDPGLLKLVEQTYGPGWLNDRVRATVSPRKVDAPQHVKARR